MEFKSLTHANKYIEDLVLQQVPPKRRIKFYILQSIFLSRHQPGSKRFLSISLAHDGLAQVSRKLRHGSAAALVLVLVELVVSVILVLVVFLVVVFC